MGTVGPNPFTQTFDDLIENLEKGCRVFNLQNPVEPGLAGSIGTDWRPVYTYKQARNLAMHADASMYSPWYKPCGMDVTTIDKGAIHVDPEAYYL